MEKIVDLLITYKNYLYALKEREEYGTYYGDTDELIEMYEEKLKIKKKGRKLDYENKWSTSL